jgi:hypothetical protein
MQIAPFLYKGRLYLLFLLDWLVDPDVSSLSDWFHAHVTLLIIKVYLIDKEPVALVDHDLSHVFRGEKEYEVSLSIQINLFVVLISKVIRNVVELLIM